MRFFDTFLKKAVKKTIKRLVMYSVLGVLFGCRKKHRQTRCTGGNKYDLRTIKVERITKLQMDKKGNDVRG